MVKKYFCLLISTANISVLLLSAKEIFKKFNFFFKFENKL